ncbi:MAG TPA: hypothetical protein DCX06_03460 [Opitutae bacterium]|nr:hypothetical protein [Opitutae bacterium]
MIRHKLTAKKQLFIGSLFVSSILLMGLLKYVFAVTGILSLTKDANLEIYLIGVFAAIFHLREQWADILQCSILPAPFKSVLLGGRLAVAQGIAFILIYFLLQDIAISRAFLIWFLIISLPLNTLLILWLPIYLRKLFNRSKKRTAVLVGKGPIPQEVVDYAERCRHFGVDFCLHFGDPQDHVTGLTRLGSLADMNSKTLSSAPSLSRVLFFVQDLEDPDYRSALDLCHQLGLRVQVMLDKKSLFGNQVQHIIDGDTHLITFADEPLQNPLNRIAKRCIDIAVSLAVVLIVLPPLTLVVWLAQRRQSPGPLFFRQSRNGLNRETFTILKFRSMHYSCGSEAVQASAADARVYPFGRLIRRMSLDEFPQFINVLKGDMSVIGPRPHMTTHDDLFEQEFKAYRIRHYVKPGITGYAQIRGLRGEVTSPKDIQDRVRHDIYYINNWNLQLDFYVACKTILTLLQPPKSAY